MSYATMDHAGWVQRNAEAARRMTKLGRNTNKGWHGTPDQLTAFQAQAMDILGIAMGGIYNAPILWDSVEWNDNRLAVPVSGTGFSTHDRNDLTLLVLLCHEARIRLHIAPHGPRMLCLRMWQREGTSMKSHPNVEEAVASLRAYVASDHPTIYAREEVLSDKAI